MEWQTLLRRNFRSFLPLAQFLELSEEQQAACDADPRFPVNVPLRLAERMEKRTLHDPLFRQFIPLKEERLPAPRFTCDPVGDSAASTTSKLLQKYSGRALILASGACAMHCRYCFRQHFPYEDNRSDFEPEMAALRADTTLNEAILSGGDPLSLSNRALEKLLAAITAIPHIRKIRFHTRFPVGIPARIDAPLLALLAAIPQQLYCVLHINHPREWGDDLAAAIKPLQKLGIVILNQAVLLRGVNDTIETLHSLCTQLSDAGVLPYYLHQLDPVDGATHFEVSEEKGHALIQQLTATLPGYAVPKYVREIAGQPSKTPLTFTPLPSTMVAEEFCPPRESH